MKDEREKRVLQFVVSDLTPQPTGHPISINGIYQLSVLQHASTDTERAKRHEHTYTNSLPPSHTNIHHVVEEGWHLLPLTTFLSFSRPLSSQTLSTSLLSQCALISSHLSYSGASLPPVKKTQSKALTVRVSGSIPCLGNSSAPLSVHLVCCLFAQQ